MSIRNATAKERAQWDALLTAQASGGNVFSSSVYAEQKKHGRYRPLFLMVNDTPVTVLQKTVFPLGSWWYLPKGPNVTTVSVFLEIADELKAYARSKNIFMIRTESEIPLADAPAIQQHGLHKAAPIIPNASTITLDLTRSLEDIFQQLPQKGRHAIRRAERDGVTVERVVASDENCRIMFALLQETARGQFGLRPYSYYKSYWQRFEKASYGQLFFASYQGVVVSGGYALVFGTKSTYKDGASTRSRQVYGASHALQWDIITWAHENGAQIHDLCGSPPSADIDNTEHPHYGIGRFKKSFSRTVVDYIGCYDIVVRPLAYRLWNRFLERLTKSLYYRRTKDYYY